VPIAEECAVEIILNLSALARKFGDTFSRRNTFALGGQQAPVQCRDTALVGVAWLLVANAGRGASAQADLAGGVFGLRHSEFATGFGRELFDQPRF
jgi:hypothetical protein